MASLQTTTTLAKGETTDVEADSPDASPANSNRQSSKPRIMTSMVRVQRRSFGGQGSSRLKLSFTSIALGLNDFALLIRQYHETQDWAETLARVDAGNLLQRQSTHSTRRVFREIRQRIEHLSAQTLSEFPDAPLEDQRSIAFLAVCKCYRFIFDFVHLVLRDKLVVFDYALLDEDFAGFWNRMAVDHPELEELSDSTRKKIRQVTVRILVEAGLLSGTKSPTITPVLLSASMEAIIEREGRQYRDAFLI